VALTYFLVESGGRLAERTNSFRVKQVVPLRGVHADRTLMPEFPGLAKAESTHDWDAGFPLVHKFREKDEAYWKTYRGTPKAFITLAAGQVMWTNRFGALTAVRYPVPTNTFAATVQTAVSRNLLANLDPAAVGLRFEPVRAQALAAANQAQDFGELFLSFSFFVIVAALILMALLFQFGLEQRTAEVGTLLALGLPRRMVGRILFREGAVLAFLGGVLGVAGGLGYAWAMMRALTTVWRDAVAGSALSFHATPGTVILGLGASVVICALTIWFVLRRMARRPARELLAGLEAEAIAPSPPGEGRGEGDRGVPKRPAWTASAVVALGAASMAFGLVGWAIAKGDESSAGIFFGGGALLLVAGLAAVSALLRRLERTEAERRLTISALALRGCVRRRKRSLATAALLACGSFLIVAIGAFRLDENAGAWKRTSGTGGFALLGETALPVVQDLNTREGREAWGLDDAVMTGVTVVPLRVREGDDASCLNLNRAQTPRLLGVKPELLAARGAFTFAKVLPELRTTNGWMALQIAERSASDDTAVPAIGDAASIQWALGKKLGETLDYTDERGRKFKVRLVGAVANSILQGSLLIDEAEFVRRFPGESGYRMFLLDAPSNAVSQVSAKLSRALQDVGLELTPASRRLAQFNAVQNTYLGTFQVLGGLGLLIGSAGLGVVVLRNVLERRSEFALLQAVGFRRGALRRLVLSEHVALLGLGLLTGLVAALIAVLPAWGSPGASLPLRSLAITLAAVLVSGLVWTGLATAVALRGRLLEALRGE
jgi:ABC-type antimicrobial peptide transport system permease subunit